MSAECDHGLTVDTCADCQRIPAHDAPADLTDCRTCGAPVIWTVTTNGKRMPVDAEPNKAGNIALRMEDGEPHSYMVKGDARSAEAEADRLHTSHFATCPQRDTWRRS